MICPSFDYFVVFVFSMQRVGCCFSLLFLSMVVNAMFYGVAPNAPMSGGLDIGPFTLTPEQVTNIC